MSKDNGGPVFARPHSIEDCGGGYTCSHDAQIGISIRDYFAAAALTGLLAYSGGGTWQREAVSAYKAADEMMRAREGK